MAHLFNTGMRNRDRLTVQTMGFANGGSHENAVQERDQAHSCLCSARRRGACAERVRREGLAAQAAACGLARGNRAGGDDITTLFLARTRAEALAVEQNISFGVERVRGGRYLVRTARFLLDKPSAKGVQIVLPDGRWLRLEELQEAAEEEGENRAREDSSDLEDALLSNLPHGDNE